MRKEITFYVFLGEKRDPSKIYANSNLRNVTHITQKSSYVYTFFTSTLKEITALGCDFFRKYTDTQISIRTRRNLYFQMQVTVFRWCLMNISCFFF
jgi:hypothetical protein